MTKNVLLLINTLPPVDTPISYTHPLSIHLPPVNPPAPCRYICPPPVNMPASCQYACLLSICLPPVDMPTFCWYVRSVVDTLASCQYACPVVDTPAMLSIHPPCCWYTRLLSIHLWPYWYTCGPINMPVLTVIVVGHGAADDVAGSMDAHIPQEGEGQGMTSRWWWWSTCLAWCEVHIHQLRPGWNLQVVGGTMALATVSSHRWQGLPWVTIHQISYNFLNSEPKIMFFGSLKSL